MRTSFWFLALLLVVLLGGCSTASKVYDSGGYAPAMPIAKEDHHYESGSLYSRISTNPLFEDLRARQVGDIIVVVLEELTIGTKNATTNADKSSKIAIDSPKFLQFNKELAATALSNALSSTKQFTGKGDSIQNNSLTGRIPVTVHQVLSNGNLMVRGEKKITINQGDELVRFAGIIRVADITTENTISSQQVANAKITYTGAGIVGDSNAAGWGTRFFFMDIWPF